MSKLNTFFGFDALLTQAKCDYAIFDLSRRVTEISKDQFADIEHNRVPYPFAIQQKARIAIAYWQHESFVPWIWFLHFPLDERSLLSQAAVGDFIQYIASRVGAVDGQLTEQEQQALGNNPYIFAPSEDKKALFHAKVTQKLSLAASDYYQQVQDYCQGEEWQQWQHLGLQGIADLCVRAQSDNNQALIINAIRHMPSTPKFALLGALEHCAIDDEISQQLVEIFFDQAKAAEVNIFYLTALVRALAGSKKEILTQVIDHIFDSQALQQREMLIAIAGRCWQVLANKPYLERFLMCIVQQQDIHFFQQMLSDIAQLPSLRPALFTVLNSRESPQLLSAIQQLQKDIRKEA